VANAVTTSDPSPGLRSIPESDAGPEASRKNRLTSRGGPGGAELHPGSAGSALAQALGEFLPPGEAPEETEGRRGGEGQEEEEEEEEDGDSPHHDASLFDQCSSGSSDSSIDIAFVRCPRASSASHRAVVASVSTPREAYGGGSAGAPPPGQGGGRYGRFPGRGCVSPDEAVMMRHSAHRPLKASQRQSKVRASQPPRLVLEDKVIML